MTETQQLQLSKPCFGEGDGRVAVELREFDVMVRDSKSRCLVSFQVGAGLGWKYQGLGGFTGSHSLPVNSQLLMTYESRVYCLWD